MKLQKFTLSTLAVALFATFLCQPAEAQSATRKIGKPAQSANRHGKGKEDLKPMRHADKLCNEAERLLKDALPIYSGHRVDAIRWDNIAQYEIHAGILWNRINDKDRQKTTTPQSKSGGPDNEPKSKYSQEEIAKSNKKLVRAGELLTQALTILRPLPSEYGGHRAQGIESIEKAIREIGLGLKSVGGSNSLKPQASWLRHPLSF